MREADLAEMAEQMLTEVLGRIREDDLDIELPAVVGVTGDDGGALRDVVARYGRLQAEAPEISRDDEEANAAIETPFGELTVRDYLLRLTVVRSLVAHYVAAYLGSTACPLPEELAKPLWELTAPDAVAWRATGLFREPLPIPELASWRDVFLRTAGHEPHPLGH